MMMTKKYMAEKIQSRLNKAFTTSVVFLIAVSTVFTQDETLIQVNTDLVNLSVAVVDRNGDHVENLQKENFEIYDNGKKQEIGYFTAGDAPVSFGIVYDMHPTTKERTTAVLESLREFAGNLGADDDIFTIVFNLRGSLTTDFVPTVEQLNTNLSGRYREPHALYDAIYAATKKLETCRNLKRVLFVITDSADHNSEHRFGDIIKQLKTLDAQIYAVLWDKADDWKYADVTRDGKTRTRVPSDASNLDRAALQSLTLRTGGTMRSPTVHNERELFRIYNQIALETRRQYTLGFYPETVDGKWHDLRINLRLVKNSKKMSLTYRIGYQSPKPNQLLDKN